MLPASSSLLEWEYFILVYTNTRSTRWRRKKNFWIPCGTITKIHLNSPPPPNAKLHKVVCLTMGKLQWRSLSLFHNGKILRIKHWNIGPTIPLQNFPSMFRLFNFNSSQVSTLFPCTRNTQNRFLVYLTTWSHIIYQGHIQESAACSCSCSSSFLLISVKFCFV